MPRLPLLLALMLVLAALTPAAARPAVDPTDWDGAVAAARAIDPAIDPLPFDATVTSAAGGGRIDLPNNGFAFPTFAFGARIGPAGLTGRMTVNLSSNQNLSATVVCLNAARIPGDGAIARLVGALEPNSMPGIATMVFDVTDGGPGGEGDAWTASFLTLTPEMTSCTPIGSVTPIDGSIAVNVQ